MTTYKAILLLFISLYALSGKSQIQEETPLDWLKVMSNYRNYLLTKNANGTIELKELMEKWATIETQEEERADLAHGILHLTLLQKLSFDEVKERLLKNTPDSKLAKTITEEDLRIIQNNVELLDMVLIGLFEKEYPFKLNSETTLFEELLAYDVKEGEKVAELDSGIGGFSLVLKRIEPNIKLYINSRYRSPLEYLKIKILNNPEMMNFENLQLIIGSESSTNLEGYKLDKIIVRYSLHHFEEKATMIRSIKRSIHKEGALYILESIPSLDKDNDVCKHAMERKEIVKIVESNGFVLVEEKQLDEDILFKFKRKVRKKKKK